MPKLKVLLLCLLATCCLSGCYHDRAKTHDAVVACEGAAVADTMNFEASHHYSKNYNFVVKADSLRLLRQLPEEALSGLPTDTLAVFRHEHIVVADVRLLPNDSIDSVWVQVARDQETFGWTRESRLLPSVVPDDPISQFISMFSDTHMLIFLVFLVVIGASYLWLIFRRTLAPVVHFNDIDSPYPMLLTILVAVAATLYASIQLYATETWRHFYYHPSLNPFALPTILSVFMSTVWAMLIVGIAAVDDTLHKLPFGQAVLYLGGLLAVCAVNYIVFTISTLHDVGYVLLLVYVVFALRQYVVLMRKRH